MSLILKEIDELRAMLDDYKSGNITMEQASVKIAIYSQLEKRMRIFLTGLSLYQKGDSTIKNIMDKKLLNVKNENEND